MSRWVRRLVTFSAYATCASFLLVAFPALLLGALVLDVVRPRRFVLTRTLAFFLIYFWAELLGLIGAGAVWLLHAASGFRAQDSFIARNYALQRAWSQALFTAAVRIFSIEVAVTGSWQGTDRSPFLLLVRHASVADTLLPAVLVANRERIRLRYVLKSELVWDPCLDVVGNRLPNAFVHRQGDARDIERVRALAADLSEGEGLMIFPEGTRFTPAKRRRLLESLEQKGETDVLRRARRLTHTLPPRLGGVTTLLEAAPGLDVVVCAHHGFDAVRSMADLLNGRLVGVKVSVSFWRIPATEIPSDDSARIEWLFAQWERVNDLVAGWEVPGKQGRG
ncbi:MAG: lysophospholipid acyltransferase family protein [Polyangiaceae bacterium]